MILCLYLMAMTIIGVPNNAPVPDKTGAASSCNKEDYQHLIGNDPSTLNVQALPKLHRIIEPGKGYDRAINFNRLTITIGFDGKIKEVTCHFYVSPYP